MMRSTMRSRSSRGDNFRDRHHGPADHTGGRRDRADHPLRDASAGLFQLPFVDVHARWGSRISSGTCCSYSSSATTLRTGSGTYDMECFISSAVLAAAAGQILMSPDSIIPMLGASGAISGVLGGYVLLFPRNQVRAIILRFYTTVPAFVAIGLWIGYQLVLGYLTPSEGGGVAYAAHIGGFVTGIALIKLFAIGRNPQAASY